MKLGINDPLWHEEGAECVGSWDIFTNATANTFAAREARELAVSICHACPVLEKCQAFAKRYKPTEGVWGGLWWGHREVD